MNPYVYSKKGSYKEEPEPQTPSLGALVKHLMSAAISTPIAFAVVIFAAGSVTAMTSLAYPEISTNNDSSVVVHHVAMAKTKSEVLGDSTTVASQQPVPIVDDSALEAGDASGAISAKPGSFDTSSGRWSYTISYSVDSLTGPATLSIGTYTVKDGITDSGSVNTGAILKPYKTYFVSLWVTDSTGAKQVLAKTSIKTGKGKTVSTNSLIYLPCVAINTSSDASSSPPTMTPSTSTPPTIPTMCLATKDGKPICPRPAVCGHMLPPTFQKYVPSTSGDHGSPPSTAMPPGMPGSSPANPK
jgi:hypothetical protein